MTRRKKFLQNFVFLIKEEIGIVVVIELSQRVAEILK